MLKIPNISALRFSDSLSNRFFVLIGFLSLVAIVNLVFVQNLLQSQQAAYQMLQRIDTERDLVTQIQLMTTELLETQSQAEKDTLTNTIQLKLTELDSNREVIEQFTHRPNADSQLLSFLEGEPYQLSARLQLFVKSNRAAMDNPDLSEVSPATVNGINDPMLSVGMNQFFTAYVKKAAEQKQAYHTFNWINMAVTLLGLLLISRYVFKPLTDSVKNYTEQLENQNTHLESALLKQTMAEQQLKDREAEMRSIVNTVIDGIITINHKGQIAFMNQSAEALFMYSASDLQGKSIYLLIPSLFKDDSRENLNVSRFRRPEAIQGKLGEEYETIGYCKDGTTFSLLVAFDEMEMNGEIFYTGIIKDVTHRKAQENQLKQLNDTLIFQNQQLKIYQQQKDMVFATIAHDLRTPVKAEYRVLEQLHHAAFGPVSSEQSTIFKELMKSNRFLNHMIDNLLANYRLDHGHAIEKKPDMHPIHLDTMLEDIVYKELHLLIEDKHHQVHLDMAQPLPRVLADSIEIRRVFYNLIQNALNYTPMGGIITISARHEAVSNQVEVRIQDNGPGIDAELKEKLFLPFASRAKSKYNQIGTGLGLYLCKTILDAHDSTLHVESHPGEGTTFSFSLPCIEKSQQYKQAGQTTAEHNVAD